MAAAGVSLLAYLITCTTILTPYFLFFPQSFSYASILSFLVVLHTLCILWSLFLSWPTNLFTILNLPLIYPTDSIRSLLLMLSDDPASGLPSGIERVLTRLGSFNMRVLYVRFGHDALATCEFCTTWSDFALYALPEALLSYMREIAFMGALTLKGTRHAHHRTLGVGALCAAAMFEAYMTLTVTINIPKESSSDTRSAWSSIERIWGGHGVVMWHDTLLLGRRLLFLILPIVIHFVLKPSPPPFSATALASTPASPQTQTTPEGVALNTIQALATKLQLLRYTRGAVNRQPTLREAAAEYWDTERSEGESIRKDEDVKSMARKLGMGYDKGGDGNGALLKSSKNAVSSLMESFKPSVFWKPTGSA